MMRRGRKALVIVGLAVAATSCSSGPAATPRPPSAATTTTPTTSTNSSVPPLSAAMLAYAANAAKYPQVDIVHLCTVSTPVDDVVCGNTIATAAKIAGATAQTLQATDPTTYAQIIEVANNVTGLASNIARGGCFGSGTTPPLSPSFCTQLAGLVNVEWLDFINLAIAPLSDQSPTQPVPSH
jgi:hypothetical protein